MVAKFFVMYFGMGFVPFLIDVFCMKVDVMQYNYLLTFNDFG